MRFGMCVCGKCWQVGKGCWKVVLKSNIPGNAVWQNVMVKQLIYAIGVAFLLYT